jgi:glyoxylase-like metal-dependent hydrolase (beta-lactamase superfamily II)
MESEIILMPGHSDDNISLILDEGIAFTGNLQVSTGERVPVKFEVSWQRLQTVRKPSIVPGFYIGIFSFLFKLVFMQKLFYSSFLFLN